MAATITQAGLTLLAQLQASGEALAVDSFIYADITLLDPDDTPPITETMPDVANINHQAALTQMGRVGDDAVVFSNILGSSVGDFYFNWVGLFDSTHDTLVAISYVARQQKIANTGTTSGNCLVKNFSLQYAALASLASVTISPETWMLDYEAIHDALQASIDTLQALAQTAILAINTHGNNTDNPHGVTLDQIGAAAAADVAEVYQMAALAVNTHGNNTDNPHAVTLAQLGMTRADLTTEVPINTYGGSQTTGGSVSVDTDISIDPADFAGPGYDSAKAVKLRMYIRLNQGSVSNAQTLDFMYTYNGTDILIAHTEVDWEDLYKIVLVPLNPATGKFDLKFGKYRAGTIDYRFYSIIQTIY